MSNSPKNANSAAALDLEAQLWQLVDALHGMGAAEHEKVCLGWLFRKYISGALRA